MLIGFYNPLKKYPSPLVPIIAQKDQNFAAYTDGKGNYSLQPIAPNVRIIQTDRIAVFDFRNQRLFALSETHIISYYCLHEGILFRALLATSTFRNLDQFSRLSLTAGINDKIFCISELICSALSLRDIQPELAFDLYVYEMREIREGSKRVNKNARLSAKAIAGLLDEPYAGSDKIHPVWMTLEANVDNFKVVSFELLFKSIWVMLRQLEYEEDIIQEAFLAILRNKDLIYESFDEEKIINLADTNLGEQICEIETVSIDYLMERESFDIPDIPASAYGMRVIFH